VFTALKPALVTENQVSRKLAEWERWARRL